MEFAAKLVALRGHPEKSRALIAERAVSAFSGPWASRSTAWGLTAPRHIKPAAHHWELLRTGTGAYPLRGHNNVQGASDHGAMPNFLPATSVSMTRKFDRVSRQVGTCNSLRQKDSITTK